MKNFIKEFKDFALRGNVVDLAIGIIIGAGFNTVVNSLVKNIILPPIGLLLNHVDFTNLFVSLSPQHFATLADAQKAGVPTINYGIFINDLISFILTAFCVFLLVKWVNRMRRAREAGVEPSPTTKQCPFCDTTIPIKAKRCPACTSALS